MNKRIDVHTHFGIERVESKPSQWNPLDNYQADSEEMAEHLKSQGVFKIVDLTQPTEKNSNIQAAIKMAKMYPGFFHFSCNFDENTEPEAVFDLMEEYKKMGAVSVGELSINRWIDDPLITAIFAAAERLGLPVTFHMSPEPGYAYGICDKPGLPLLEQALRRFPNLKLIGHSQTFWLEISKDAPTGDNDARSKTGAGPVVPGGAVPRLLDTYQNLYCDLSAYSGYKAITRDEDFGIKFLEKFKDRLMYGSDTLNKLQVIPLGRYLDECAEKGILTRDAYEKICYGNAQKLFNI